MIDGLLLVGFGQRQDARGRAAHHAPSVSDLVAIEVARAQSVQDHFLANHGQHVRPGIGDRRAIAGRDHDGIGRGRDAITNDEPHGVGAALVRHKAGGDEVRVDERGG